VPSIPDLDPIESPSRRRFRLSLRVTMLLIAGTACGLGWFVRSAQEQRRAVDAILARGGTVDFDYKYDDVRGRRLPKGESWRPIWLQRLLGDEYFHTVSCVGLDTSCEPTDEDLVPIARLSRLKLLYLGGGKITDDGLARLGGLTDLRLLILWGNPIEGDGLKHLRYLKKLRHLDLSNTQVTDRRLVDLRNLTGLGRIDIPNNRQLNGAFLEYVKDLPHLKDLVLRGSGITDAGLTHLEHCDGLESLMLDRTKVTEAGLSSLRRLPNLRSLDLSDLLTNESVVRVREWFPRASVAPLMPDK
jgi:hypothetical protein